MKDTRRLWLWIVVTILWAACVTGGFAVLAREEYTPVARTAVPVQFPENNLVSLAVGQPTLLVFLHPQCPCSRATLHELGGIVGATGQRLAINVIFTIPPGTPVGWEQGELWNESHALDAVRVVRDPNGEITRQFHVTGSGHALLYDATGRLLFSGGITASRGEEGDNAGETAVVDWVTQGHAAVSQTPVFGCSLL